MTQATGFAYEVVVVMDQKDWKGPAGEAIKSELASSVPGLPQAEPSLKITYVQPKDFTGLLRYVRNILVVTIDPTAYTKVSVGYENNVWARGQVVVSLKAPNTESIVEYSKTHEKALVDFFVKVEMNRAIEQLQKEYSMVVMDNLKSDLNVEPLAHMICMGSDKAKAAQLLDQLNAAGVRNVLTLRGDRTPTRPESPDFAHASDLAQFVWQTQPEFDIHAACYPEGHPEAATLAQDVANLRFKQEAGATHLLTQLFFDNMHFYRFLNLARRAGITLPVSAGVMPIVKRSQIERTVALSSASLPSEFTRMISRYQDDPESLYAAGVDYAVQQLRDLIEGGADGVHLYAMNDAKVAAAVYEGIKDLL